MNFHFHIYISLVDKNFDKRNANIVSSLIDFNQDSCNNIYLTIFVPQSVTVSQRMSG